MSDADVMTTAIIACCISVAITACPPFAVQPGLCAKDVEQELFLSLTASYKAFVLDVVFHA